MSSEDQIIRESFDHVIMIEKPTKEQSDRFIIKGILLSETTSDNGVKYTRRVLEQIFKTGTELNLSGGTPVMKDHVHTTDNTVGKLTKLTDNGKEINYEGFVLKGLDEALDKRLEAGLINKVSVGYVFEEILCSICEKPLFSCNHIPRRKYEGETAAITPEGAKLKEISLVPVPGLIETSLSVESYLKRSFINKGEKVKSSEIEMTNEENKVKELQGQIDTLMAEKTAFESNIEARDVTINDLKADLKKFYEKAKDVLIEKIMEVEKINKIVDKDDDRKKELEAMSQEQLEAIYMVNEKYRSREIKSEELAEFNQTDGQKPKGKSYGNLLEGLKDGDK